MGAKVLRLNSSHLKIQINLGMSEVSRPSKEKKRIDVLLTQRGLAPSRERAQAMILAGQVLVDDSPVTKPGALVLVEAAIRVRGKDHPYVSRGGVKLAGALDAFGVEVTGKTALDIGCSTGGFTDVLLKRGATKVLGVDVGHNLLDWSLRQDPRVELKENVNARYLKFEDIGATFDVIVVDVSFISLSKILPALIPFAKKSTDWITLIKPQFEVGPERVGKGGIVRSIKDREDAVQQVTDSAAKLGLERLGLVESSIKGTDGNQEYLAHWKQTSERR